ncbi:anaphase-promoting complex subunit Hcn1, partial [Rhizoclosmatium sp. JEL0117]
GILNENALDFESVPVDRVSLYVDSRYLPKEFGGTREDWHVAVEVDEFIRARYEVEWGGVPKAESQIQFSDVEMAETSGDAMEVDVVANHGKSTKRTFNDDDESSRSKVKRAIMADIVSLRSEVLRQTDKLISQINTELSSRQAKSIQWAPTIPIPVNLAEGGTMSQAYPCYTLGSSVDHHAASTFSQINADLKKSHLDLGIHWDDGDYKVASAGSKPTPIFSDTSLTLLQQMVVGTANVKNETSEIASTKGVTTKQLRLSKEDVSTSSPAPVQRQPSKSKSRIRRMSWTVGPSPSILKHSDTDSESGSDVQSKVRKARRSTATASKLSTEEEAYPISSQPQTSPENCLDQIYDIVEVATPPYMSPPDSLKKHFPVPESVQSSGRQVVVNVEEKDETASDSTEVKEEEKQSQDSVKKIKHVMSRNELNDYVKWKNLSPEIEKKLFSYYEIKYRGKFFEEETLLNTVNDSLKQEIVLHNTRWLIEKVTFLRRSENDGRDEIFFSAIASKLHACYYTPGDFITKQGESAADMYFIVSGKCDVYVGDKKVVSLYDGAYFGDMKERIQKLAVEREIAAQVTTCNSKSVAFPETTTFKD